MVGFLYVEGKYTDTEGVRGGTKLCNVRSLPSGIFKSIRKALYIVDMNIALESILNPNPDCTIYYI